MLIRLRAELNAAYEEIARLEHALCESSLLAARAAPQVVQAPPEAIHIVDPEHDLTARERDVLVKIMAGLNTKEISLQLYVCESTVKSHLTAVYHKLGVHNRSGAAMAGVSLGLLEKVSDG